MSKTNRLNQKTSEVFGSIFPLLKKERTKNFRSVISAEHFQEPSGFIHNRSVLILGCGGLGEEINAFVQQGARRVVGIDLSEKNIATLKKKFKNIAVIRLYRGDICQPLTRFGLFDIIYSGGVIHHTSSPQGAVHEAFRVLAPGGLMVVYLYGKGGLVRTILLAMRQFSKYISLQAFVHSVMPISRFLAFFLADYLYAPIQHHYTESEAKQLFVNAGFQTVERLPNQAFLPNMLRFLLPSQLNYRSLWSRILYGHGSIILKAYKN